MKHRWFHRHKLWFVHIFPILCTPFVSIFFSILLGHNKNQQTWIWICFLNDATAVHRCHPLFGSKCGISVLIGLRSQQRPKSAGHAMVDATEQIVLWNLRYFFHDTPRFKKWGTWISFFIFMCFEWSHQTPSFLRFWDEMLYSGILYIRWPCTAPTVALSTLQPLIGTVSIHLKLQLGPSSTPRPFVLNCPTRRIKQKIHKNWYTRNDNMNSQTKTWFERK